ncbi:hypothetical protein CC86DRAFT_281830 [Ophiobolus disseminans]|uniref:DUF7730 domain-containing protein n=1 Tax=Ophiobolus disseminans TaxID=1469910 RepID=A0A6A7ACK0_9PLEO|nr:hypothetical protein CC86DRAFT_281830 [Ophiobolus disseminans]
MQCRYTISSAVRTSADTRNYRTTRNQKASPLLRLPPEIRNTVYTYALGGYRISLNGTRSRNSWTKHPTVTTGTEGRWQTVSSVLGITFACRQTYLESSLMFFDLNEFGGKDIDHAFENFFDTITEPQRVAIRHWWFCQCHVACVERLEVPLDTLPKLQKFTLKPGWGYRDPSGSYEKQVRSIVKKQAGEAMEVVIEPWEAEDKKDDVKLSW